MGCALSCLPPPEAPDAGHQQLGPLRLARPPPPSPQPPAPPLPGRSTSVLSTFVVARKLFHCLKRRSSWTWTERDLAPHLLCSALTAALSHRRHLRSLTLRGQYSRIPATEKRPAAQQSPAVPLKDLRLLRLRFYIMSYSWTPPSVLQITTLRVLRFYEQQNLYTGPGPWMPEALPSLRSLSLEARVGLDLLLRLAPPELCQLRVKWLDHEGILPTLARDLASHLPRLTGLRRLVLPTVLADEACLLLDEPELVLLGERLRSFESWPQPSRVLTPRLRRLRAAKPSQLRALVRSGVSLEGLESVLVGKEDHYDMFDRPPEVEPPTALQLMPTVDRLGALRHLSFTADLASPGDAAVLGRLSDLPVTSLWLSFRQDRTSPDPDELVLAAPRGLRTLRLKWNAKLVTDDQLPSDCLKTRLFLRLAHELPELGTLSGGLMAGCVVSLTRDPALLSALAFIDCQTDSSSLAFSGHRVISQFQEWSSGWVSKTRRCPALSLHSSALLRNAHRNRSWIRFGNRLLLLRIDTC